MNSNKNASTILHKTQETYMSTNITLAHQTLKTP